MRHILCVNCNLVSLLWHHHPIRLQGRVYWNIQKYTKIYKGYPRYMYMYYLHVLKRVCTRYPMISKADIQEVSKSAAAQLTVGSPCCVRVSHAQRSHRWNLAQR